MTPRGTINPSDTPTPYLQSDVQSTQIREFEWTQRDPRVRLKGLLCRRVGWDKEPLSQPINRVSHPPLPSSSPIGWLSSDLLIQSDGLSMLPQGTRRRRPVRDDKPMAGKPCCCALKGNLVKDFLASKHAICSA